ncbi:DUF2970 domain-containing protein [Ramlibacter tataouinensis]|uniref:DUF2970 domain-containing protein n=1 Tax=Ramlibacter tataouinensis TaxID=94132 RepID=UPI0022F3CA35|nr:DUF2970 domain-containing protein [Ramlibacter tataouinensis]WBY00474.1 DUF2970 domain-containing protein [Ramlibacter tataouinensis]
MSFLRTARAVAWSFFGVRKRSGWEDDARRANPLHVVAVGLVGIVLVVAGLIALVNWVV